MNTRVHITPSFNGYGDGYNIYIIRDHGDSVALARITDKGELLFTKVEEGSSDAEPTLRVPGVYASELFPALAKAVQMNGRFPLDGEASLRGKLEATLGHLADMRKLVFKEKI